MKKILTTAFALGLVLSLGACGKSGGGSVKPADDPNDKVLADNESYGWALHGNFRLDENTINGWNGKDNELYEASKMTAISINQAKAIDADLGAALAQKDVMYLYKFEGAILGVAIDDVVWKANFKMNDKLYKANGTYCFKAVKLSYDAEEEVYAEEQWIPHDHDGNTECLTPDTLWLSPNFAEEADEDGFSWDYNPVAKAAGVYTIVVAQYKAGGTYSYAMGLVKTADKEGVPFEEVVPEAAWVATEHTYGLIGTFNSWGGDVAMSQVGEQLVWKKTGLELAANAELKVRADGEWDNSWGFAQLDAEHSAEGLSDNGGNIKFANAGTYDIEISFAGENPVIVITEDAR